MSRASSPVPLADAEVGTNRVDSYCLKGTSGVAGALLYTGTALRAAHPAAPNELPKFAVTPHGQGAMELLDEKPLSQAPPPPTRPRRTASTISDEGADSAARRAADVYVAAAFRGQFEHGKKHGWGTLSRTTITSSPVADTWTTRTIKCAWKNDVPQLLSDPCTITEEEERIQYASERSSASTSKRTTFIYCGLAMAVHDASERKPQNENSNSGSQTLGGFSSGLSWALHTRFLPDALGERIDVIKGTRYCGEFQCGLRHGFGVVTSLSSHAVIYVGMFDNDLRHGSGTSVDEDRELIFDGVWADDGIAPSGGTLHLPPPAPLAIQGQKWASATSVASGFLVNVRGAHTGMWEPLLAPLDEALPSLISSLESIGSTFSGADAASPGQYLNSPSVSPSRPPDQSLFDNEVTSPRTQALSDWERDVAIDLSHFEQVHDATTVILRELNRVRITACHAITLGVTRRALAAFQRCMLFLYGSCGAPPALECGGGGNQASPGNLATSWCRLVSRNVEGFACCHVHKSGQSASAEILRRAVQAASSVVMSLRLRLMTCHGAAPMTPQLLTPQRGTFQSETGSRGESMRGTHGSPLLRQALDSELRGEAAEQMLSTTLGVSARCCNACCHCAAQSWVVHVTRAPARTPLWVVAQSLRSGGFSYVGGAVAAVLSGTPLQSSSSKLVSTTWDVVASSCAPLLLSLARPAHANQCGQFCIAMDRLSFAAAKLARRLAPQPWHDTPPHMKEPLVDEAVATLLLPAELMARAQAAHDADVPGLYRKLQLIQMALADVDAPNVDAVPASVVSVVCVAARNVAMALLRRPFPSPEEAAEMSKLDTTDVGPLFAYMLWPLPQGKQSPTAGSSPLPASPRGGPSAASLVSRAGSREGLVSSRIEALVRALLFCRAAAAALIPDADEETVDRLGDSILDLAVHFASQHRADLVLWAQLLLRITSPPLSLGEIAEGELCAHDAHANVSVVSVADGISGKNFDLKSLDVGTIPALKTAAVAAYELSALGAFCLHKFTCSVAGAIDSARGIAGPNPAGGRTFNDVLDEVNTLFGPHMCVPASVLASGCATARIDEADDASPAPAFSIIPTARQLLRGLRKMHPVLKQFLYAETEAQADQAQPCVNSAHMNAEVEDHVLLAVTDWALGVVGDHSVAPTKPVTKIFPLRCNVANLDDVGQLTSEDDEVPAPMTDLTPPPAGVAAELDTAVPSGAGLIDFAMKRCYSDREPELRRLRLRPLVDLLQHLGLSLTVIERETGPSSADANTPMARRGLDVASPGVVNVDPSSALHLRIELDPVLVATQNATDGRWIEPRQGSLRLPALLVERLLAHWRRLRRCVEAPGNE
jgi:hypothetical protein